MTERLYYLDSYKQEFEAEIVSVSPDGQMVAFDRTLFFATGGGQPNDTGKVVIADEEYEITDVTSSDGTTWHKLDRTIPSEFIGREVKAAIDWGRRYGHMRHHTALHLLNGVGYHAFGALVTGAQVYNDHARIDLTLDDLGQERVEYLEREANVAIDKALPILAREVTQAEAAQMPELIRTLNAMPPQMARIRTVEIEGLDRQFCGGTHVRNASEVGKLKISGTRSKGKQNKRIEIVLE